jgi:hypothetical protein
VKTSKLLQPRTLLFLFVFLNLVIGFFIVPDYGRVGDEDYEELRSELAFQIYSGSFSQLLGETYEELGTSQYYGTAISLPLRLIERIFTLDPLKREVAHFGYFAVFQIAVIALFFLSTNFFHPWISLSISFLFGTQPLLFGHGFVNPKDMPLMTFFLLTIVVGFKYIDKLADTQTTEFQPNGEKTPVRLQKRQTGFLVILGATFLILWLRPLVTALMLNAVEYSYLTKESSLLGQIFSELTTYGSLTGYLILTEQLINQIYLWVIVLLLILITAAFYWVDRKNIFGSNISWFLFIAAFVWGYGISVRVINIAAGAIVGTYGLLKIRRKAVFPLFIYTITASIISYVSWPFLWVRGLNGYLKSLDIFSDFPWNGVVLFEGNLYLPDQLPLRYIPKLISIQFTEPVVVLALAGTVISGFLFYKKKVDTLKISLVYLWLIAPVLYVMVASPTLYHNFRQLLFITPPLFILAGFSLQALSRSIKSRKLVFVLSLILIMPSLYSIIHLHPYQYVYYNAFIGGVKGAEDTYLVDYWDTSYKDAINYLDKNVPAGSKILIWKDNQRGERYAEKYLIFQGHTEVPIENFTDYDYAVFPVNLYSDISVFTGYPVIYSVKVDSVDLVHIAKISQ